MYKRIFCNKLVVLVVKWSSYRYKGGCVHDTVDFKQADIACLLVPKEKNKSFSFQKGVCLPENHLMIGGNIAW